MEPHELARGERVERCLGGDGVGGPGIGEQRTDERRELRRDAGGSGREGARSLTIARAPSEALLDRRLAAEQQRLRQLGAERVQRRLALGERRGQGERAFRTPDPRSYRVKALVGDSTALPGALRVTRARGRRATAGRNATIRRSAGVASLPRKSTGLVHADVPGPAGSRDTDAVSTVPCNRSR